MKEKNVTVTPVVIPQSNSAAVGARVDVSQGSTSVSGGAIHSNNSTTFFGSATKEVSPSTSLNVQGSVNTKGSYQASGGITLKW